MTRRHHKIIILYVILALFNHCGNKFVRVIPWFHYGYNIVYLFNVVYLNLGTIYWRYQLCMTSSTPYLLSLQSSYLYFE